MSRLLIFVVALGFAIDSVADVTRASRWIDRVVLTSEGELLGRVEDFALEQESLKVSYVVVSVGSYLIDNNLIAVTPDSLSESDDGAYLVIPTDALEDAPRFADDSWPEEAQIDAGTVESIASDPEPQAARSAEIVASDRRLTLGDDGQASITTFEPAPVATTSDGVVPKTHRSGIIDTGGASAEFLRFDVNKDGYLSRREIAPYFGPGLKFSSFDTDGNGGLDPFEMDVLQNQQ